MSAPERTLVTGGAGFIGSHVVDALVERGDDVLVVDDLSAGVEENVHAGASFVRLDIREAAALSALADGFVPTGICHLAAQASVTASVRDPGYDLAVNVHGTLNVLELARASSAPVVFASTGGALYGDDAPVPTAESFPPEPLSPYGAAKLAGEAYVATWSRLHGLANVTLRLGNVYGPRQNAHGEAGVVAIFSELLREGKQPKVYGDGTQTRDYIHVSDVAAAFVTALAERRPGVFNVGTGIETDVLVLLAHLQEAAGTSIEPAFAELRAGELRRSSLDSSALTTSLGWQPQVEISSGLAHTYRYYADA